MFGSSIKLSHEGLHTMSQLFMATLTNQSCSALVPQALLVDLFGLQKCLSTAGAVGSLCGPVPTHWRSGMPARDPSSKQLLGTPHLRARCGPL
jgi:hypothetical protein